MAVVGGVPGAVTEGDVGPGQLPDLRIQSRMVLLDDGQVVGAASAEVGTVLVLGMQCVAGQHGVVQIDGLQQGLEGRYFVALGGDLPCRWARIVPRWSIAASSWIADRVAVRDPRTVLPSTAIARGTGFADVPDGGGGVLAWRYVPMAVSSASPSRRWSRRRTVAACGAGRMPVSGSGGKPRVSRTVCGASAIHSPIAMSDRAPVSTAAAAAHSSAGAGYRRPRRPRGSGTSAINLRRSAASSAVIGAVRRGRCSSPAGMGDDVRAGTVSLGSHGP
ncbi:hypothetical protein RKD39_006655 [Streptomyces albogriseolus]